MFDKRGLYREVENEKTGGIDAKVPRRHVSSCCFQRQCSTGCAGLEVHPRKRTRDCCDPCPID
jgi:hypothetical protein